MRNLTIVLAVIAATLGTSTIVSAGNAAGEAAVSAVLARQKQMEQIGRTAGNASRIKVPNMNMKFGCYNPFGCR